MNPFNRHAGIQIAAADVFDALGHYGKLSIRVACGQL